MSPALLLERVTGGRGHKAIKYSMVSVIAVVCTQVLLILFYGIVGLDPTVANTLAVSLSSVPAFILNRRWVWGRTGPSHFTREVLPFWGFALVGLVFSNVLVSIAHGWSDSTLVVAAANISAFGLLWVGKFLFLDRIMFGHDHHAPPTADLA